VSYVDLAERLLARISMKAGTMTLNKIAFVLRRIWPVFIPLPFQIVYLAQQGRPALEIIAIVILTLLAFVFAAFLIAKRQKL
jgi:hypothetical protein